MKCPYCSYEETKVIETRANENNSIRRRRECVKCERRFTTYEKASCGFFVMKKNGVVEEFDKDKIRSGLIRACNKRPVSRNEINKIINDIEREILDEYGGETIKSSIIGKKAIEKLKKLDQVAYLRFASVFHSYNDIRSFKKELRKLEG